MNTGRLYNLVVDPAFQGHGYGSVLLKEGELESARRGCTKMVLEVRCDNKSAIKFYERHGYKITSTLESYYEDHAPGYKMTKTLNITVPDKVHFDVPYYPQTLDFTCGSACLIMAQKYFYPNISLNRVNEINLWREATLVFMTSGHGGMAPHGMALAAIQHNLGARVLISTEDTPFLASVRTPLKREVIELVHEDLVNRAEEAGITTIVHDFTFEEIANTMYRGMLPIVLISTFRVTGDRVPHWVVVFGFDSKHVYFIDPDLESYNGNRKLARNVMVTRKEFQRISRYGKLGIRSAILISKQKQGC